jgi:hypothetical protein
LQQLVETGALLSTLGTADTFVAELGNDLPAVPLSYGSQFAQLVLHGLSTGTDPGIECGSSGFGLHGRPPDQERSVLETKELFSL